MGLLENFTSDKIGLYLKDPLRKNAIFLMAANALAAIFGFIFWIVAARYYPPGDVGRATALISTMALVCVISRFGFDISMVRFLPRSETKRDLINTYLTTVGLFSVLLSVVFILGLNVWSPELAFVRQNAIYVILFILVTAATSVLYLQEHVFIAFRKTEFALVGTVLAGLRIPLVAVLVGFGAMGIFSAWGISVGIALVAATVFVFVTCPGYRTIPVIRKKIIKETFRFSFGNYIAEGLKELPKWIMPLIVITILSPEMSAYFYIAWTVASILFLISYATCFSLLAHGSQEPAELRSQATKAARFILWLVIPATAVVFFFGDEILNLFGAEYTQNAFNLLKLLSISSIPLAVNIIYITIKRVQMQIKPLFYVHGFIAVVTIAGSAALMGGMGIIGVGIAWLAANGIVAVVVAPVMFKMARSKSY